MNTRVDGTNRALLSGCWHMRLRRQPPSTTTDGEEQCSQGMMSVVVARMTMPCLLPLLLMLPLAARGLRRRQSRAVHMELLVIRRSTDVFLQVQWVVRPTFHAEHVRSATQRVQPLLLPQRILSPAPSKAVHSSQSECSPVGSRFRRMLPEKSTGS